MNYFLYVNCFIKYIFIVYNVFSISLSPSSFDFRIVPANKPFLYTHDHDDLRSCSHNAQPCIKTDGAAV